MSATVYDDLEGREIGGKGLMSSDENENPTFYNFHHVYVPYCSSDAWLGRNYVPRASTYPSVNGTGEFSFQGSVIFRGIIDDLCSLYGMDSSTEVILVGSSASGVGVLNHAQWVQGRLNNTRIRLIIDSAWFINFEMVLSNMVSNELGQLYNISSTDIMSCLDTSRGYPCCLSPACHLMHSSLPNELPSILFIFSQYDIYALQFIFEDGFDFTFTNVLRLFNNYGSAMITYSNTTFHRGNFSFFIPSCAQHRFLVPSEFWSSSNGLLRKTTDTLITHSNFEFSNPLEPGKTWNDVSVNGLSLKNAITQWYNNDTTFYYVDSCDGPICNPNCPDSVVLISSTDLWGTGVAVIIFILATMLTITCVVIKSMLYVCQIYILHKQKKFVNDMTDKEDRGLAMENLLPSCTQYCSVSCINLTYRPDVYKSVNKNNKNAAMENVKQAKSRQNLGRLVKNRTKQTTYMPNENVIIKDINLYFNPGEMVAIMGPSGCGKTTLLDVLTGRRVNGETEVSNMTACT